VPLYSFEGKAPIVHPPAFVAPTACLIGDVTVEAGASAWSHAVLRADVGSPVVREGASRRGTDAEARVDGHPTAYRELARPCLAGSEDA
jgi:hypothetical protein